MAPSACAVRTVMDDIVKSAQDKKLYRHIELSNGLSALLIHDPEILNAPAPHEKGNKKAGVHEDEGSGDDMDDDDEDETGEGSDEDESMGEGEDEESDDDEGEDEDGSDEDGGKSEGSEGGGGSRKRGKKGGAPAAAVKKAAAAMAVGIGSLSDPPYMQGLSHYLEHMLFMGSTKYPDENDYDDFITKHSGTSNAFTELEYTNFHFEVAPDALKDTLDRFAQFFISPLMQEGSLEREVLAVDSEFTGVQQSDECRISQLMCHTARPGHPYRQFSWGNKKSLWDQPLAAGLDIRQHIQDYYKKHYSAERMSLVLLGGESLDTLQEWVLEMFADLPVGKGPRPSFASMTPPFQGHGLYVVPAVRDLHEVSITFQLPCMWSHYGAKAEHYVSHLVGHEGPGSLLSYLKSQGWANEVCAGVEEDGYSQNSGTFLFSITIGLTESGLYASPGCGLAAVGATFAYLKMLRDAGPQEWVWREMACMADMKFRFQEEEEAMDMCTKIASAMHLYSPRHVLAADYLHERYDPKLVMQVMSCLHPLNSEYRVDLLTRQFAGMNQSLVEVVGKGGSVTEDTEPWFNLETAWAEIPTILCATWAESPCPSEMHLPPPNPYIATDFTVKSAAIDVKSSVPASVQEQQEAAALAESKGLPLVLATPPQLIKDQPGLRVWHKLDRTFTTPRANVYFRVASPKWCACPRSAALTHLGLKLLEDALNEDSYLADVAGLHYSTAPEGLSGIELKVDGFSHKLPLLASRVLGALAAAEFTGATWGTVHEALCRKYRNMNMQVAKHANYERLYAICSRAIHYTLLEPHLHSATLDDVKEHFKDALKTCHLEVFCHGNLTRDESVELAGVAQDTLGIGCVGDARDRVRDCCVALPEGESLRVVRKTRNEEEENCCVEVYYQVGIASSSTDRALLDLVDQMVYEPAYNALRTQQQLGYTVHTGSRLTHGVLGFCAVVVSSSHTAEVVDARIEEFFMTYGYKLSEMTEDEFVQQKVALKSNKLSRDRALADESTRHWDNIWNERYDFFSREAEVAALDHITLEQVRHWWSSHLHPTSPSRRKLAVHVVPTKTCPAAGTAAPLDGTPASTPTPGAAPAPAKGGKGSGGKGKGADVKANSGVKAGGVATRGKGKKATPPAVFAPVLKLVDDVDVFKAKREAIRAMAAPLPPIE